MIQSNALWGYFRTKRGLAHRILGTIGLLGGSEVVRLYAESQQSLQIAI